LFYLPFRLIRAVIVDDESKARNALKNLLTQHCPEISVVGEGDCVRAGVEKINDLSPDVVFLDVQMPDGTGFDLLEQFSEINFKIIFASAFDKFAIQAFKFSALDYMLKPVEPKKLKEACAKLNEDDRFDEINKKLIVKERKIETVDEEEILKHSKILAKKLWDKMQI